MAVFPRVPLTQLLRRVKDEIDLQDETTYKQITIRLWNKGVVLRGEQQGSDIKTKRQYRVRTGQLVLSRIDVRNGAIGLLPPALDGAVVSNDFWAYDVDQSRADPDFLALYVTTPRFIEDSDRTSSGTTKRIRAEEDAFLRIEIPLPPLAEQRRIVARIEALARRVEEARGLRREAVEEAEALEQASLDQAYQLASVENGPVELESVCRTITDGDHVTPRFEESGVKFIFVGNVSSGQLHFRDCKYVAPSYFSALRPQRKPRRGDVLYSAVGATLGIPALVDSDDDFCFQRHVAIIKPDTARLDSKYLWHMLRSGILYKRAWSNTTGSAQPTVPLNAIRRFPIPVSSVNEQRRIVAYLDGLQAKVDELKRLQAETQKELDALMPSILARAFAGEL